MIRSIICSITVVLWLSLGSVAFAQTTQPAARKTYSAAPKMTIDVNKKYTATIDTAMGKIVCELFPKEAPQTVNSFVFLARDHFYDGLTFHRIILGFMIQGGDPNGDGSGGPGYTLPLEAKDNPHLHDPGALAMARTSDPDSAGCQFYITAAAAHFLDPGALTPDASGQVVKSPGYTVFGNVVEGMDVVKALDAVPVGGPSGDAPTNPPVIKSITIKEE